MEFPPEFYANYYQRRKLDLETLRNALNEKRIEDFKRIGHQIKGNAPSFGFDDLAEIAKKMETVTDRDLNSVGSDVVEKFKKWIDENNRF
jgi:HPt (histidine-containing phosphotransfer) domain-containing protein